MRLFIAVLLVGFALSGSALAEKQTASAIDWDQWRHMPVQDGGRQKPLDTLAWETLRRLCNRGSFVDPESGRKLSPAALYLAMIFDWQGWDKPRDSHAMSGMHPLVAYHKNHETDKWDRANLLRVDFLELRDALGMDAKEKYISPLKLRQAKIRDPRDNTETSFTIWAGKLLIRKGGGYSLFEKKGLELADKLWTYQNHRMGRRLEVLPVEDDKRRRWLSIAQLMQTTFDDETDPTSGLRKAKEQFAKARAAYLAGSGKSFNEAATSFIDTLKQVGPKLGSYPNQATIDMEVSYNRWVPFRFAWVFTMLAFVFLLLAMGSRWKTFYVLGWVAFAAALVAMFTGFTMRYLISGWVPVTNMYESVIYVGLGAAVFGVIFELLYRKKYILAVAAAISTMTLILADNCPAVLDPSFQPLQPVLRSNYWLIIHVMSITLSYAAFALALGISNITLGYYLFGAEKQEEVAALSKFTYKTLQVGVLLLAMGTILGGVWADDAWGRFWGWDPKEVWALIALLGYLAVLHARYIGWAGHRGLAALSVACFSLVVMAWYGVNFVLGAGLHSYGFGGGGGQGLVLGAVALQLLYVVIACSVSVLREASRQTVDPPRSKNSNKKTTN